MLWNDGTGELRNRQETKESVQLITCIPVCLAGLLLSHGFLGYRKGAVPTRNSVSLGVR